MFVGPADLAADLGFADRPEDPAFWEAVTGAIQRIRAAGAVAGIFPPVARLAQMRAAGATVFGVGSDAALATQAMRALAAESAP